MSYPLVHVILYISQVRLTGSKELTLSSTTITRSPASRKERITRYEWWHMTDTTGELVGQRYGTQRALVSDQFSFVPLAILQCTMCIFCYEK